MKRLAFFILSILILGEAMAQTTLTEAVNFQVKTTYGEPIWLFPLLDDSSKIVVIDFFSTTCGPCQDYAPDFQASYEDFGYNEGNVYFMGINWGNDNEGVMNFDSVFGLTFPSASGSEGGGNIVYTDYDIQSYPTVIVITPDHNIAEQYVWYPTEENINNAVIAAGGTLVGTNEVSLSKRKLQIFPNPIADAGTAECYLNDKAILYLAIYNILGNKVFTSVPTQYQKGYVQIRFMVDKLESGYYIAKIASDKGVIATTRISVINKHTFKL